MEIRPLIITDAPTYWNLRLEALLNEPRAFGKAPQEHQASTIEETAARFRDMPANSFTLGAFHQETLVGIATFVRETGLKETHKGHIYGVYVTASARRAGLGRALLAALLDKAKQDPSLEQILLAVTTPQTAALHLYRTAGFEIYGTEPRALKMGSEYLDEHLMFLRLR